MKLRDGEPEKDLLSNEGRVLAVSCAVLNNEFVHLYKNRDNINLYLKIYMRSRRVT